ncbi:hypothetical protein DL93DRAFT_2071155 [Clavulina sp. PMI_390]|nr:hypothetical protein DL93DRAFT_2071155 [Clavulina sp. PMI_390]
MDLTRGNAVFLVQGVLFCSIPLYQIPKALLQLHSQAFKDMLEGSQGPDEEPIQLEDELEAFRDLCATLMTWVYICSDPLGRF